MENEIVEKMNKVRQTVEARLCADYILCYMEDDDWDSIVRTNSLPDHWCVDISVLCAIYEMYLNHCPFRFRDDMKKLLEDAIMQYSYILD